MMFVLYYAFKFPQEAKSAVIRSLSSSMNYPSFFFLHIFLWQTCKRKEKNSLQFSWKSRPVLLADSPAYQQTLEAEKSTLEAIKPPLTAVLLNIFKFRGFSKYGCKQQEACLYIFHCPLSAATLSRVFHRFLPFPADTQVISRDFLFFLLFQPPQAWLTYRFQDVRWHLTTRCQDHASHIEPQVHPSGGCLLCFLSKFPC